MMSEPTVYRIDRAQANPSDEDLWQHLIRRDVLVAVGPEHRHQWLPWLTLPNGSSWTQCTGCGEEFQYDHVGIGASNERGTYGAHTCEVKDCWLDKPCPKHCAEIGGDE